MEIKTLNLLSTLTSLPLAADKCYRCYIWQTVCHTVKPVMRDHPTGTQEVVLYDRWSFIGGANV